MADGVKEEEFGNNECLDQHHGAGGNDGYKAYDIHHADDIEDDVAWTSQRSL